MKHWILLLLITLSTQSYATLENTTCQRCHPVIYAEYQNSMHAKASIFKDPVHKAVWDKHPAKKKGKYKCAKCHTPSDKQLMAGESTLVKNEVQQTEPISCQLCHKIESVEKHTKTNKNIISTEEKTFFSADKELRGQKIVFKEESHLLGLLKTKTGSPYHDIDYSNENFYNGNMCMGCHSHKQNSQGFAVCDMEVKQGDSKETCISCHMPQVKGSLANQKESATHAFHGHSIHAVTPTTLSKYIKLTVDTNEHGFIINIKNEATHTLFSQPLRLNQLRVSIEREGKVTPLETESFLKVIGKDGKPAMPWLANEVLKDTLIKALETRKVSYSTVLKKDDVVLLEFGYYLVNPKAAKKLGITDESATKFIVLTKERVKI
jgi:predicted  nucleic acid-binding Zn-ribbon protein